MDMVEVMGATNPAAEGQPDCLGMPQEAHTSQHFRAPAALTHEATLQQDV